MKNHLFTLMLICLVIPTFALKPSPKGFKYISNEGKFSMVFPAQYEIETGDNPDAITVKISTTVNEQTYFVGYTLHSGDLTDVKGLAKTSVNSFSETLNSTIDEQSEWKIRKNSGLQATMTIKETGAKVLYYVIIIEQIQYQLIVAAPNSSFDEKAAKAFIKSFKLKK